MPQLLVLGGLDPGGGAGITADAVVAAQHGVHALPVAVALTVQNRRGFTSCREVPRATWQAALAAAVADGDVHAIKVGLLGDAEVAAAVGAALAALRLAVPIVVDPVLSATAGGYAPAEAAAGALVEHVLPLATVVTPNAHEARVLFGDDVRRAFASGCRAVLRKDGHGEGAFATDVLLEADGAEHRFARRRLPVGPVHGTGCALATALACRLAAGRSLVDAAQGAGDWLWRRLAALGVGTDGAPARLLPLS